MSDNNRILVAGAGPFGMIAALGLARRGVPVTIFEAEPELPAIRRATTFHPPTLDMLGELDLVDEIIRLGHITPLWQFRDRKTGPVAVFDMALVADLTNHPYRVQCEQFYLTGAIRDALEKLDNAEIRFEARVIDAQQDADQVSMTIDTPDGEETVYGSYVVAAEGGRSGIRSSLPVDFEGFTYDERIVQCGTTHDYHQSLDDICDVNYISDPEEWCVLLKLPGYWRVGFRMDEDENQEEALTDEALQARLQRFFPKDTDYDLMYRNTWRVHHRVASSFRHGRILLGGDAAHINSPQGGMGMNSGIHDGINLAEKLAAVWRGEEGPELLDRYSRQRRHVALEDVRVQTMRNAQMMNERDLEVRKKNLDQMRGTVDDPEKARSFLRSSSMMNGLEAAAAVE